MQKRVFISGPIQGRETRQSYRQTVADICRKLGFETIDPWKREKIMYRGNEKSWWNEVPIADFIKRDLEDIKKCDILIAYLPRLSAGTCMELFYAKLKGKTTICITQVRSPSPWITHHSDVLIKKIRGLAGILRQYS
jgi:nucleoside 2-deoxyribosyltransferase